MAVNSNGGGGNEVFLGVVCSCPVCMGIDQDPLLADEAYLRHFIRSHNEHAAAAAAEAKRIKLYITMIEVAMVLIILAMCALDYWCFLS